MSDKIVEFKHNGKDYRFAFDPQTDDPAEGPTLTYVGDENGRLQPSVHAEGEAWKIARQKLGLATK